jgi:hypothetical protein
MKYIKNLNISADNEHNFKINKNNIIDECPWFMFDLEFIVVTKADTVGKGKGLSICWNGVGGVQLVATQQDGIYIVPEYEVNLLEKVMKEYKDIIKEVVREYSKNLRNVNKIGKYGLNIK